MQSSSHPAATSAHVTLAPFQVLLHSVGCLHWYCLFEVPSAVHNVFNEVFIDAYALALGTFGDAGFFQALCPANPHDDMNVLH